MAGGEASSPLEPEPHPCSWQGGSGGVLSSPGQATIMKVPRACADCFSPLHPNSPPKAGRGQMSYFQSGGAVAVPPPQDLIVDQTIEKVSFCAPDRNFDKAFSYICRDGTTRRWICHGFLALKDSVRAVCHTCTPPATREGCCPWQSVSASSPGPLPGREGGLEEELPWPQRPLPSGWPGCPASPSWI